VNALHVCCVDPVTAYKQVFFTGEKLLYINPPVSSQNDRVGLLAENVMSLQFGCWLREPSLHRELCVLQGKGRLHFVLEKSKVYADCHLLRKRVATEINGQLPPFVQPTFHISARWSTCACSKIDTVMACSSLSRLHRQWRMASKQSGFKSTWLPCLGLDAGQIQLSEPQPKNIPELKTALLMIWYWEWDELTQEAFKINRQLPQASPRLRQSRRGGRFEFKL